jgi:hypothetical protein
MRGLKRNFLSRESCTALIKSRTGPDCVVVLELRRHRNLAANFADAASDAAVLVPLLEQDAA